MQRVEVRHRLSANSARVFSALMDAPGWTRWAGVGRIVFEKEGDEHHVGAIRVFRFPKTREQILTVEPGRRFTYAVLSGVPIRNHSGETAVEELPGGGCEVVWRCQFESAIPGFGRLTAAIVSVAFRYMLRRLGRFLDRSNEA